MGDAIAWEGCSAPYPISLVHLQGDQFGLLVYLSNLFILEVEINYIAAFWDEKSRKPK